MLFLERKAGERIMVGRDMIIQISEVHPDGTVCVGIAAPKNVQIVREEICNAKGLRRHQKKLARKNGAAMISYKDIVEWQREQGCSQAMREDYDAFDYI